MLTTLLLLLSIGITTSIQPASGSDTLIQVQVISRHGARTALTKTASALLEGGAVLTPIGEKQLYDLGVLLKNKYSAALNLTTYDSGKIYIQSSDFDRTVVSASSMALGLFPKSSRSHPESVVLLPSDVTPANIPIHTKDRSNDIDIRSYTLCPLIQERLAGLYDQTQFMSLKSNTANQQLLQYLALNPNFVKYSDDTDATIKVIKLEELWNVYDSINVAKTECDCVSCDTSPICLNLPDSTIKDYLTISQWQRTTELAHQVELIKFGKNTTGSLIGANLLRTISERMGHVLSTTDDERRRRTRRNRRSRLLIDDDDHADETWAEHAEHAVDPNSLEKFIYFSGHYPTLLGLYSTLNLIELNPNTPISNEAIPEYGSALIFELWLNTKTKNYEVVVKHVLSDIRNKVTPLLLPCQKIDNVPCTLNEFYQSIRDITKQDNADTVNGWCTTCKNNVSDLCIRNVLQNQLLNGIDGGWSDIYMMGSMFLGMALAMGIMFLCMMCVNPKNMQMPGRNGNPRREVSMGTRHGTKRAGDMEQLKEDDDIDGRI
tara:strand:+ start:175 stop:1815 length:1641 start_codon:yes stop_codon:yes gene_type:complete